jgi:hypothetical protein
LNRTSEVGNTAPSHCRLIEAVQFRQICGTTIEKPNEVPVLGEQCEVLTDNLAQDVGRNSGLLQGLCQYRPAEGFGESIGEYSPSVCETPRRIGLIVLRDLAESAYKRVQGTIRAKSDEAFRELIRKVVCFYREALFNPHWGEQIALRSGKILDFNMVFQALDQKEAEVIWRPLLDWVAASSNHLALVNPIRILAAPARLRWDSEYLKQIGLVLQDDRPGASPAHVYWAGNQEETGMVLHAYQSAWIPASLLQPDRQEALVSSLFAAAKHWEVVLHTNKGLAGGTPEAIATARDTAMNPAVADAFALLICANAEQPAYPGIPGHEPDVVTAREHARAVERAMKKIRSLVPMAGSYVAESDYFKAEWQRSFWGPNYQRLLAIKERYDPEGLFFVHHGVGAERWSLDGFRKIS